MGKYDTKETLFWMCDFRKTPGCKIYTTRQAPAVDWQWWLRNQTACQPKKHKKQIIHHPTFLYLSVPPLLPVLIFITEHQKAEVAASHHDQSIDIQNINRVQSWNLWNIQMKLVGGEVMYVIIPAAQSPSLSKLLSPLPHHPLSVASHQKIQVSHSWVTETGCILSLLSRSLNPSQSEPGSMQRR